jgi:hypothetical protein
MSVKIDNPELFRANIRKKIEAILENDKNSTNLEKGIFNFTLKEADQRKIVKKWDNKYFVQIYIDHLRSIIINLKGDVLKHIKDGNINSPIIYIVIFSILPLILIWLLGSISNKVFRWIKKGFSDTP